MIWIFDSRASQEHALSTGADKRRRELTAVALNDAGVHMARCVSFDFEEECRLRHGGDWRLRLAKVHTTSAPASHR
nr:MULTISPECIES: hypothetical protein [Pseudomonas]